MLVLTRFSLILSAIQLKKEISEVILQRDAAQSQVKDLLQTAEEDRPSVSVCEVTKIDELISFLHSAS